MKNRRVRHSVLAWRSRAVGRGGGTGRRLPEECMKTRILSSTYQLGKSDVTQNSALEEARREQGHSVRVVKSRPDITTLRNNYC